MVNATLVLEAKADLLDDQEAVADPIRAEDHTVTVNTDLDPDHDHADHTDDHDTQGRDHDRIPAIAADLVVQGMVGGDTSVTASIPNQIDASVFSDWVFTLPNVKYVKYSPNTAILKAFRLFLTPKLDVLVDFVSFIMKTKKTRKWQKSNVPVWKLMVEGSE